MELTDIRHITEEDLTGFEPDLVIVAAGYESRSTCISDNLEFGNAEKVVISFKEGAKELSRPNNDRFFEANGFKKHLTSGIKEPDFNSIFKNHLDKDEIKILIDISVMTRVWYHSFLKFLYNYEDCEKMDVRVAYCAALFNEPMTLRKKVTLKSFLMENEVRHETKNSKKTALIMGLGIEKEVSVQISEKIKPDLTYLIYADPSIQKNYVENVFINNHELISNIDIKNLKGYNIQNTKEIYDLLIDIALPLRKDYHIVIVPQGPKIFSLMSMIFQMGYPDIDLMYPQYKVRKNKDKKSSGNYVAVDLGFILE